MEHLVTTLRTVIADATALQAKFATPSNTLARIILFTTLIANDLERGVQPPNAHTALNDLAAEARTLRWSRVRTKIIRNLKACAVVLAPTEPLVKPPAPGKPSVTVGEGSATVAWSAEPGVRYRAETRGGAVSKFDESTTSPLLLRDLEGGKAHETRLVGINGAGESVAGPWSDPFTPTQPPVLPAPVITEHPASATITEGGAFQLSVAARNEPLTYQWQNDGFGVWGNMAGQTARTYGEADFPFSASGRRYRCLVTNATDTVPSNPAQITVIQRADTGDVNPFTVAPFYLGGGANGYHPARAQVNAWRQQGRHADADKLDRIARQPYPAWIQVTKENNVKVSPRALANHLRTAVGSNVGPLLIYAIPYRDRGWYSQGGWADEAEYRWATDEMAAGFGDRKTIITLEPDGLPDIFYMPDAFRRAERVNSLRYAVSKFTSMPANHVVYIDAGNPLYPNNGDLGLKVGLLQEVLQGNTKIRGFALNMSNFHTTAACIAHGNAVSDEYHRRTGKRLYYTIDSGRNGSGLHPQLDVINPPGRTLGDPCRAVTEQDKPWVDAFYWFKPPGESDGNDGSVARFDGTTAPGAGGWWTGYAMDLVNNTLAVRPNWPN